MFSIALVLELLIVAVLKLAYLVAWGLLIASLALAVFSTWKADLRNSFLLWLSSVPLFIVLWSVPHLHYYFTYGIRSKTVSYSVSGHWLAILTIGIAVFLRGKAKWPPILAATLAYVLVSVASRSVFSPGSGW